MAGEAPAVAHEDLLHSVYDAFNERDLDFMMLLLHPDVDWLDGKVIMERMVQHIYHLDGAQIVSMHIHEPHN
jgi:ketosteroid isomerase-like protein